VFDKEIEELIAEHKEILSKIKEFENKLKDSDIIQLSEEVINFFKNEVENHAKKEDEDFLVKVLSVLPDYDAEAFSFAHNTIREGVEDLEITLEEVKNSKKPKSELIRYLNRVFTLLKDHFLEEENFFFPDIRKTEEKEWL